MRVLGQTHVLVLSGIWVNVSLLDTKDLHVKEGRYILDNFQGLATNQNKNKVGINQLISFSGYIHIYMINIILFSVDNISVLEIFTLIIVVV